MTDSVDGETVYTYDAQGQLISEKVTPVGSDQETLVNGMTYDRYGNILSKTTNGVTNTYEYNCTWKDKLTAVNGVPIVYDNLGNPISYLGNTLTWEKGRQLKQFTKADGTIISYTYNANGIRTSKTVGGVQHTYALDGTKILRETWGDCTLIPLYDNEDSVCGIMYDDAAYYFHKNLQGDVIEIKNAYGVLVARYSYDAWGKVISITNENGLDVTDNAAHVANANPFRYRGYYYDAEIGMYYLQSRYYDPSVGRFVNGDDPSIIDNSSNSVSIATNKFCYCFNSPINDADDCGSIAGTIVKMIGNFFWGMFAGMLGLYLANVTLNIANGKKDFYAKNDTWGTYIAEGVKSGAFSIFGSKLVYKIIAVIGASVLKQIIDMIIDKTSFNFWGLLIDILIGIAFVLVIHFGPTIIGKLSKKQKKSKYKWIEMLKELIKKIANFITNKLKNVINNLINFFKNTFAKRFSISYAKKIAPELLKIFFN